jgi:Putative mono-oxygenase ydhR
MYTRVVTFRLDGITPAEYREHAVAVAPAFTTWPGLLAKVWIADDDAGTYGGIYLFADRASADHTRDSDLYRSMAANPAFADLSVREFDVLDEPTAITAPSFAQQRPATTRGPFADA